MDGGKQRDDLTERNRVNDQGNQRTPPKNKRRLWCFRCGAILLGMSPFLIAELGIRLSGWRPPASADPFVGFQDIRPLFELTSDRSHYEIPVSRREYFEPDGFLAKKPDNEFRIFCLGGSTVQGRPYSIKTSFTTWLELSLKSADPSRSWNVVNCGGVSYASYRLAPIMEECLQYQPDLFVIYTGHNEFLEHRSYNQLESPSSFTLAATWISAHSRLVQLAGTLRTRSSKPPSLLSQEVDALLDYRGGLESYHRDPQWREQVTRHFGVNVRRMLQIGRDAAIPVLVVNPVSNLRDSPPFKVETRAELSQAENAEFGKLLDKARRDMGEEHPREALKSLRQALQLDDNHAAAWFLRAHCHLAEGETDAAREAFVRAKDADVCPLRMTEALHVELRLAVEQFGAKWIDARAFFQNEAHGGLVGDSQLVDHVHPKIDGHQAIARLLFEQLVDDGVLRESQLHEPARRKAFRRHWDEEIDEAYMARGQQKLEGLRRWATGRAFKVRQPEEGFAPPP